MLIKQTLQTGVWFEFCLLLKYHFDYLTTFGKLIKWIVPSAHINILLHDNCLLNLSAEFNLELYRVETHNDTKASASGYNFTWTEFPISRTKRGFVYQEVQIIIFFKLKHLAHPCQLSVTAICSYIWVVVALPTG